MIPGDLASRLRVLLESTVQPLSVVHETPSDLPRFERGQQFTAQILSPLPDGTFRALVAGKTVTLALPDAAKGGDVLELVAAEHHGNTLIARNASTAQPAAGDDFPKPQLSQTGQMISQLMTGRFGEIKPVPLSGGEPLLPTAPRTAAELAPVLQQAVSKSGLFYEAHLQQWAQGKLSLEVVKQEPQALAKPVTPQAMAAALAQTQPQALPQAATAPLQATLPPEAQSIPSGLSPTESADQPAETDEATATRATILPASSEEEAAPTAPTRTGHTRETEATRAAAQFADEQARPIAERIPDKLMPLVHHQLETLATQQMSWQGQMWPGMNVQLELFKPDQQGQQREQDGDTPSWRSALQLSLPRIGNVGAMLVLGAQGLTLRLDTDNPIAAQRMKVAQQTLANALEAAGIKVAGIVVTEHADA